MMAAGGGFFYLWMVCGGDVERYKLLKIIGDCKVCCILLCGPLRKTLRFLRYFFYARSVKGSLIKGGLLLNWLQAFFFGLRGWLILRLGYSFTFVPSASHFLFMPKRK